MIKKVCACAVWLLLGAVVARSQDTWSTIRPGLETFDGSFADHNTKVTFLLLRCDPKKNQVRIIDTFHEVGRGNSFAAFSVREIQKKTNASLVANAGSTASYSLPAPVGLLEVGGRVISKPNYRAEHAGIICITAQHISILPLLVGVFPSCTDAVQRGPFFSRETKSFAESAEQKYRRTVVAVDGQGRLLILVTRERASLSALASFLYTSPLGLNVQSALNLDGDVSSGLVLAKGSQLVTVGNVDGLNASSIAIYKKD